ncbi:MAG: FGGY-family carbohydrate kinase [Ilumatobacteraceae bacterium]
MSVVAAVDCGATSIRVCRVDLDAATLTPEVVHRVTHTPWRDAAGHLHWDWTTITTAVTDGLERCHALGPLDSIGIDTWAVDYGLLDDTGSLIGDPYSYRDHRTDSYVTLVERFGAREMYAVNGLQLQPFNTIFQLAVHDRTELDRATRLLWLPELLVHHLTGTVVTERTSAGSSGLADINSGTWSPEMLTIAGIDESLLGKIEAPGRLVGEWRGIPVALVGGHDTASAVIGMGPRSPGGSAFVASGTWMLAGIERPTADTSEWARTRNYTNEAGALGGVRFLRNVTGFWLLEQCRTSWGEPPIEDLLDRAAAEDPAPIVNVDDPSLRAPDDMLATYTSLAGVPVDTDPAVVARSIIESIAARVADVIDQLGEANTFDDIVLFGGAARIDLLVQQLAERTRRDVRVGPPEAATIGNAIVQGIAIGDYATVEDGRAKITTDHRTGS